MSDGTENDVTADLARMARAMQTQQGSDLDVERLLLEVTESAVRMLPGVAHGDVTLVVNRRRRELAPVATTGPVPRIIGSLQEKHQQGPCIESMWDHHTVRVDDFEAEKRWPNFVADLVEQTGVRSSLSIELYTNESELGTLNLYSEESGTFTSEVEEFALALATHAAIALASARRGDQLQSALASRDTIAQAKGIIMERFQVTSVAAFTMMTRLSQESNTSLYEIARKLGNP
ncbi:ANTAR domain-containing protein [Mycobacterium sp. ITM-2016-00318]|uniref:GAF and ANTAR domain-containing protein n=1 Tax=Mycobacterium sp. ITM-2016-00318 TaxID=2099693 RepID=UPI001E289A4F|nr:ANTAR domain-containing protein [Mycobacterium sp. ITM-2016-00318]WNG93552.1 ANTAR domain-containing protein [Mycobacterium sp. ITM-2016-00318]